MAENLNYGVSGSYCYDNDLSNCDIYGRLYEWKTAMSGASSSDATTSGVQGVCPSGWHLPSDAEWTILNDYVDANNGIDALSQKVARVIIENLKATAVGNSLKATRGWTYSRVSKATDQFGFSALPTGTSEHYGMAFVYEGVCGQWWSTSESSSMSAYYRRLGDCGHSGSAGESVGFRQDTGEKYDGFSVPCLKDIP